MRCTPYYSDHFNLVGIGWQRQAESSELADGVQAHIQAIGKLTLAAATHLDLYSLPTVLRQSQYYLIGFCLVMLHLGSLPASASKAAAERLR